MLPGQKNSKDKSNNNENKYGSFEPIIFTDYSRFSADILRIFQSFCEIIFGIVEIFLKIRGAN